MTFITVETKIEVDTKVFGAIAITAAEGGIGHWAQIDKYDWTRWTEPDEFVGDEISVDEDFVFYRIAPTNDYETGYEWDRAQDVTPAFLARGLGLFLRAHRLDDPSDISCMDAAEADMVVQYAFFGEQVYG